MDVSKLEGREGRPARRRRGIAALAALLIVATGIGLALPGTAVALPAGTPPFAEVTMTPGATSGTSATAYRINLPPTANRCPTDVGTNVHRVNTFMVPSTADPATLTYNAFGPIAPAAGVYTKPLYNLTGAPVRNLNTVGGLVVNATNFSWLGLVADPPATGRYRLGIACTLNGETMRYWEVVISIRATPGAGPANFTWAQGSPPDAVTGLVANGNSAGGGVITGSFTPPPAATPPVTGYSVTATPTGGGAAVPGVVTGTTFQISGLAVGQTYDVTVIAINAAGDSPPATLTGVAVVMSPFADDITVVRPQGALVLTQRCGVWGSASAVTDPLIGPLAPIPATSAADPAPVTGYPITPRTDGTAPNLVTGPVTPGNATPSSTSWTTLLPPWASSTLDTPNFDEYPYPTIESPATPGELAGTGVEGEVNAVYPTRCGIDLGRARLLTSGPGAGQYFWSTGTFNQITVVDTRDADDGWTLNGRMSNFVSTTDAGDFFAGDLLGWNPEVTWDSTANLDGYDMTVEPGDPRNPVATGAPGGMADPTNTSNTLRSRALAQAAPFSPATNTGGLGMAVIDGRLRLLIPVSADAGTYRGTLTFTAI